MEPMTPEERFMKIENAMQWVMENLARHEAEIEKNSAGIRDLIVLSRIFLESQKEVTEQIKEMKQGMEEGRQAQRGLTQAQRGLTQAQGELTQAQRGLTQAQHELTQAQHELTQAQRQLTEQQSLTEAKLNALIETVDRIIGKREN